MYIHVGELEDDATLTDERAESADLTPHGRHYQPSIDLNRFQKLIESEERTASGTREDTCSHKMPQSLHTTRSIKTTETLHSGQTEDGYMYIQPHATKTRAASVEEQNDENSSVDLMSELSSIPPEIEGRANITVDSETSSVHPPAPIHSAVVGRGGASEQPIRPIVTGRDGDGCQIEGDRRRHQPVTSSLSQHPLHVVHKVAPSSYKKGSQEVERDVEQGHQDKVHTQLHTLEQVGLCSKNTKSFFFLKFLVSICMLSL